MKKEDGIKKRIEENQEPNLPNWQEITSFRDFETTGLTPDFSNVISLQDFKEKKALEAKENNVIKIDFINKKRI